MNGVIRERLKWVIAKYGTDVANDARRCEAFLRDLCPVDARAEINALVTAVREKVVGDLLNPQGLAGSFLVQRTVAKLKSATGLGDEIARWTMESWAEALGIQFDLLPLRLAARPSFQISKANQRTSETIFRRTLRHPVYVLAALAVIFGTCALFAFLPGGTKSPLSQTEGQSTTGAGPTSPASEQKVIPISAADASQWVDKQVTIRMVIRSTGDLGWAFVVNSASDFRDPNNLALMIENATAGEEYKKAGISDIRLHFVRGSEVEVTGTVQKYKDQRTGRESFQIRVEKSAQLRKL